MSYSNNRYISTKVRASLSRCHRTQPLERQNFFKAKEKALLFVIHYWWNLYLASDRDLFNYYFLENLRLTGLVTLSALKNIEPFLGLLKSLSVYVLQLQPVILFKKHPTRKFCKKILLQFLWIATFVENKNALITFPDNFRSSRFEVNFSIIVLKYLRKFPRKHWWSVSFSTIKKYILP